MVTRQRDLQTAAEGGAGGSNDRLAHVYFAWADHLKQNPSGYFPYTPSLPLLYGLREALADLAAAPAAGPTRGARRQRESSSLSIVRAQSGVTASAALASAA